MKRVFALLATLFPVMATAHDLTDQSPLDMSLVAPDGFEVLHAQSNAVYYECTNCSVPVNVSIFVLPSYDPIIEGVVNVFQGSASLESYTATCHVQCSAQLIQVEGQVVLEHYEVLTESTTSGQHRLSRFLMHGAHVVEIYVVSADRNRAFMQSNASTLAFASQLNTEHP